VYDVSRLILSQRVIARVSFNSGVCVISMMLTFHPVLKKGKVIKSADHSLNSFH
jgi:hypothetical protein